MAQSQISNDNNSNMLFHLSPGSIPVQSKTEKNQKSNNGTTDQVQQQQSGQSLMHIVWQQTFNSSVDNCKENGGNDSSFFV